MSAILRSRIYRSGLLVPGNALHGRYRSRWNRDVTLLHGIYRGSLPGELLIPGSALHVRYGSRWNRSITLLHGIYRSSLLCELLITVERRHGRNRRYRGNRGHGRNRCVSALELVHLTDLGMVGRRLPGIHGDILGRLGILRNAGANGSGSGNGSGRALDIVCLCTTESAEFNTVNYFFTAIAAKHISISSLFRRQRITTAPILFFEYLSVVSSNM